ncbi:uncharacterized protein LOC144864711 [Branchiostoma floridae x Branchiostoma japonicum]
MRVLCAILLGSTLLLSVSSAAVSDDIKADVAKNAGASLLQLLKDVTADSKTLQGTNMAKGCEGHQDGDEWGTPEHENCFCDGQVSTCFHAECPPGSVFVSDHDDLWVCADGGTTEEENGIDLEGAEDAAEARLVAEEERGLARDITVPKSWDDVIEQLRQQQTEIRQLKTEMTKKDLSIREQGNYIERCESGVLTTPYASILRGSGSPHRDLTATFGRSFRRTPTVTIGVVALDVGNNNNLRIRSQVTGSWPSHFIVRISTWGDTTEVYSASVHWMACA